MKGVIKQLQILQDQPLLGDVTSPVVDIQWVDNVSIEVNLSGTASEATGDVTVEVSNTHKVNPDGSVREVGSWNIVPNMDVQITAGVPASLMLDMNQLSSSYLRLRFDNEFVEEGDITTIADDGLAEETTITCVADVSGSLNDTYFLISSVNAVSLEQEDFYVWFNVDAGGTDPMIPGRTGVPVAISEDDTAATVASAVASALDALTGDFDATPTSADVAVVNVKIGSVPDADNGAVSPGFTFLVTQQGVDSNLNNTYFLLGSSDVLYYVWLNVDGLGTDPAVAGATGVEVTITAGSQTADDVAAAVEAAIDTDITTITPSVTDDDINFTQNDPAIAGSLEDGAVPTGFTFDYTTGGAALISAVLTAKAV